ncbi:MAG TPA: hypothetical protein VF680_16910 [Allosphingosinicella sp.]|jgi:hypothetical protein
MFAVLNHIDNFETIINKAQKKYTGYSYTIKYVKEGNDFNVEITIKNDNEPKDSNVPKRKRGTYGVLQ